MDWHAGRIIAPVMVLVLAVALSACSGGEVTSPFRVYLSQRSSALDDINKISECVSFSLTRFWQHG
jgi:hypothetical protein